MSRTFPSWIFSSPFKAVRKTVEGCMVRHFGACRRGPGACYYIDMATSVKWTGKVVGGVLGMLTLGPIGAAVGLLLGHQFDEQTNDAEPDPRLGSSENLAAIGERFFRATFRVMGYLAKADGRISEREISAARGVMSELNLNPVQVRAAIDYF